MFQNINLKGTQLRARNEFNKNSCTTRITNKQSTTLEQNKKRQKFTTAIDSPLKPEDFFLFCHGNGSAGASIYETKTTSVKEIC